MKIHIETPRLYLRDIEETDEAGMFELDSDPEVHRYLGNNPVQTKERVQEVIDLIRQQYRDFGIARWAVVDKKSQVFLGWAGLKYMREPIHNHVDYYDLGYRFIRKYWGNGYATEAARATVHFGFTEMQLPAIYGIADTRNTASCRVLEKAGLSRIEEFEYEGEPHHWFEAHRRV